MKRSLTDCDPPPKGMGLKAWRKWAADFYSAWRASRPMRSETCDLHENPDGTQVLPRLAAIAKAVAPPQRRPFEGVILSRTGTLRFKVLASDINGHAIAEQIFTVSGSGYVYAHVADDGDYLETTWELLNGASVPANTEHDGYFPLIQYTVASGVLTLGSSGSPNLAYGPVEHLNSTGTEHWWG